MARKTSVDIEGQIIWPACCARCGAKDGLTSSRVSIGSVRSVGVAPHGLSLNSTMATLSYPVCRVHAGGLGLAAIVTRRTGGFRFLRAFIYLLGFMGALMLLAMALRAVGLLPPMRNAAPPPFSLIAIQVAALVSTAYLVFAFRALPVRLIGQSKDTVTIRFSNDEFAERFDAQNQSNLRDVPWWRKFVF
jgi:hypothetical protein